MSRWVVEQKEWGEGWEGWVLVKEYELGWQVYYVVEN